MRRRLKKKLRSGKGYSLAESLVAVMILLLVTAGMVTGISLASRQYRESMLSSESKVLCSTLASVIRGELRTTTQVETGTPLWFFSEDNGRVFLTSVDNGGHQVRYGRLALGSEGLGGFIGQELIPSGSYTYGMAAAGEIQWSAVEGCFTVTLTVVDNAGAVLAQEVFDVTPMNDVTVY